MTFTNPTRLRLGMHATFEGKDYAVVGRSVLGETEAGGTYYWNEFNLVTGGGEAATLVYDETESTSQWRLFTPFEPEYPMTAADAATKRVGDRLNLTGDDVRVTFRGSSRIYHLEGQAPEGEQMGDVAEYFNAEAGEVMQVVSWTGEEVEYYYGTNLTRGMVASAFGLPPAPAGDDEEQFSAFDQSETGGSNHGRVIGLSIALVVGLLLIVFDRGCSCSSNDGTTPVANIAAGAAPLTNGATGTLFDKTYRVTAHALVETAEVGARWERHEYELTDDSGGTALLVCGDRADGRDWICFEPFHPDAAPSPKEAAARKIGEAVELDGYTGRVDGIFLSTIEEADGAGLNGIQSGTVSYGFRASNEYRLLLVRWNDAGIQFFRGRTLNAKKAAAGFASGR